MSLCWSDAHRVMHALRHASTPNHAACCLLPFPCSFILPSCQVTTDGIITVDASGVVCSINAAACALLRLPQEAAVRPAALRFDDLFLSIGSEADVGATGEH